MAKLSVTIITLNEQEVIRDCLASVTWADEIIVIDAQSTDDTVKICREFTDRIYIRPWPGFAAQKEFALHQSRNEWVLSIDADERVRPELQKEIKQLLSSEPAHDGYRIARRSYFLGKRIRHCGWYPGYQVRLFRKGKTRLSRQRVHEGFLVQGSIGTLKNDIDHYSHDSLFDSLQKLDRYSTLEALDRFGKRVTPLDFLTHPFSEFWRKYIVQKGFLEGMHGFLLAWIAAFLKMVLYMKLWHLSHLPSDQRNLRYGGPDV